MQAGFFDVVINDLTPLFAQQSQQDLAIIEAKQDQIVERFGKQTYDYAYNSWSIQGRAFEQRELLVGVMKAVKK